MDHGVELLRQARVEIVALPLRLRQVDDADGALKTRPAQSARNSFTLAQGEQKLRQLYFVKQGFITARKCRAHALALRRLIPIRSCRDRARVGREPDEHGFAPVTLAHELPDV